MEHAREPKRLGSGGPGGISRRPRTLGDRAGDPLDEEQSPDDLPQHGRLRDKTSSMLMKAKRKRPSPSEASGPTSTTGDEYEEEDYDYESGRGDDEGPVSSSMAPVIRMRPSPRVLEEGRGADLHLAAVPRKARSAMVKRPELPTPSFASASIAAASGPSTSAPSPRHQSASSHGRMGSPSAGPSSVASQPSKTVKRVKPSQSKQHRAKAAKTSPASSPLTVSEQEQQVAEALFDLANSFKFAPQASPNVNERGFTGLEDDLCRTDPTEGIQDRTMGTKVEKQGLQQAIKRPAPLKKEIQGSDYQGTVSDMDKRARDSGYFPGQSQTKGAMFAASLSAGPPSVRQDTLRSQMAELDKKLQLSLGPDATTTVLPEGLRQRADLPLFQSHPAPGHFLLGSTFRAPEDGATDASAAAIVSAVATAPKRKRARVRPRTGASEKEGPNNALAVSAVEGEASGKPGLGEGTVERSGVGGRTSPSLRLELNVGPSEAFVNSIGHTEQQLTGISDAAASNLALGNRGGADSRKEGSGDRKKLGSFTAALLPDKRLGLGGSMERKPSLAKGGKGPASGPGSPGESTAPAVAIKPEGKRKTAQAGQQQEGQRAKLNIDLMAPPGRVSNSAVAETLAGLQDEAASSLARETSWPDKKDKTDGKPGPSKGNKGAKGENRASKADRSGERTGAQSAAAPTPHSMASALPVTSGGQSASGAPPAPMGMAGWSGGMMPGYYAQPPPPSALAAASAAGWPGVPNVGREDAMAAAAVASAVAAQMPYMMPPRRPWKRCASHVYIAHFIDYQQQMARQASQYEQVRSALFGGKLYPMTGGPPSGEPSFPLGAPTLGLSGGGSGGGGESRPPAVVTTQKERASQGQEQKLLHLGPPSGQGHAPQAQQPQAVPLQATTPFGYTAGLPNLPGIPVPPRSTPGIASSPATAPSTAGTASGQGPQAGGMPSQYSQQLQAQLAMMQQAGAFPFPFTPPHFSHPPFPGAPAGLTPQQAAQFFGGLPFGYGGAMHPQLLPPQQPQAAPGAQGTAPQSASNTAQQKQGPPRTTPPAPQVPPQTQAPPAPSSPAVTASASAPLTQREQHALAMQQLSQQQLQLAQQQAQQLQQMHQGAPERNQFATSAPPPSSQTTAPQTTAPQQAGPTMPNFNPRELSLMHPPVASAKAQAPQGPPSKQPQQSGGAQGSNNTNMHPQHRNLFQGLENARGGMPLGAGGVGPGPLGLASVAAVMAPQGHTLLPPSMGAQQQQQQKAGPMQSPPAQQGPPPQQQKNQNLPPSRIQSQGEEPRGAEAGKAEAGAEEKKVSKQRASAGPQGPPPAPPRSGPRGSAGPGPNQAPRQGIPRPKSASPGGAAPPQSTQGGYSGTNSLPKGPNPFGGGARPNRPPATAGAAPTSSPQGNLAAAVQKSNGGPKGSSPALSRGGPNPPLPPLPPKAIMAEFFARANQRPVARTHAPNRTASGSQGSGVPVKKGPPTSMLGGTANKGAPGGQGAGSPFQKGSPSQQQQQGYYPQAMPRGPPGGYAQRPPPTSNGPVAPHGGGPSSGSSPRSSRQEKSGSAGDGGGPAQATAPAGGMQGQGMALAGEAAAMRTSSGNPGLPGPMSGVHSTGERPKQLRLWPGAAENDSHAARPAGNLLPPARVPGMGPQQAANDGPSARGSQSVGGFNGEAGKAGPPQTSGAPMKPLGPFRNNLSGQHMMPASPANGGVPKVAGMPSPGGRPHAGTDVSTAPTYNPTATGPLRGPTQVPSSAAQSR